MEKFKVRRQIVIVLLLPLQCIEDLKEIAGEHVLTNGTAANFDSLRHRDEMWRCEESSDDIMLLQYRIGVGAHGTFALAARHMDDGQLLQRLHRESIDSF